MQLPIPGFQEFRQLSQAIPFPLGTKWNSTPFLLTGKSFLLTVGLCCLRSIGLVFFTYGLVLFAYGGN